jgi:hypothetical protein
VLHLRPPFYAYEKANIKKVLDNNKPGVRVGVFDSKFKKFPDPIIKNRSI